MVRSDTFPQFRLKITKVGNMVHAVIARAKKVKLGISNDFWKAQTMLFHKYQHENLCTCLLYYVKTVLKSAFSGEKLCH